MLAALDVRFAFVWGLLAFALNYIPNIGSVLAALPPIIQVLVFNGVGRMGHAGRTGCPLRLCLGSTGLRAELYS
ncbi:hypothetical protein A9Y87_16670 [Salmonella enterica subsp. enterica]|nr:hypothetical protein A9Y87_16670 [Salmonella enterica subsp. enterica]